MTASPSIALEIVREPSRLIHSDLDESHGVGVPYRDDDRMLFFVGLVLNRTDPSIETAPAETFAYWQDNHGQHQIVGLLVAPLIAFLLLFFGAGLKRRLEHGNGDAGHGSVAFGGALLGAAMFALVGMLEAAMTNAAHEGEQNTVYTLNQLHSYDWLGWNAAFAAMLIAAGLGAAATGCCRARSHGRRS